MCLVSTDIKLCPPQADFFVFFDDILEQTHVLECIILNLFLTQKRSLNRKNLPPVAGKIFRRFMLARRFMLVFSDLAANQSLAAVNHKPSCVRPNTSREV